MFPCLVFYWVLFWSIVQVFCLPAIIINVENIENNQNLFSWLVNQHIRMISEASCDTEDCSNDAENSDLITGINSILQYDP